MNFLTIKYVMSFVGSTLLLTAALAMGQSQQELFPLDESQFADSVAAAQTVLADSVAPPPPVHNNTAPATSNVAPPASSPAASVPAPADENPEAIGEGMTQNAVIEGIQLSSEPGEKSDEKVISCYFIFRDKPSSYFYEVKAKEKKIVFEFNDTKTGSSPIPSTAEAPIRGFTAELQKIDINKEVKGLKPEYHSQVRVTFQLDKVPEIHVVDEYNVISFSYKWSDNPAKTDNYVLKEGSNKTIWISSACVAGVGAGVLGYYIWKGNNNKPPVLGPISIDGLPDRPTAP
jgi:hypothetical protein